MTTPETTTKAGERARYVARVWTDEPGKFLRGGVKYVESSKFNTRQEVEDWIYAMSDYPTTHLIKSEIRECK